MSAIQQIPGAIVATLAANDDLSSPQVPLGFDFNFFGTTYQACWVQNNGTLTFAGAQSTYTPYALTSPLANPILAALLTDVDTRNPASALVTYGTGTLGGRKVFFSNWVNVGYFNQKIDKRNSFQCILVDRSDIAPGDADWICNFDQVQWETGDASGGKNGLGGVSAAAGYSNGSGTYGTYLEFPGSRVPGSFLDNNYQNGLIHNSGSPDGVLGRYLFPIRAGVPQPPILPPGGGGGGGGGAPTFPTGDLQGMVNWGGSFISLINGRSTNSDSDDFYEIEQIPIGLYSVLFANCGFVPQLKLVTIAANLTTNQDVVLAGHDPSDGLGYICGWAADLVSGAALPGALVSASSYSTRTDAGGGFILAVPVGVYTVTVQAGGFPLETWGAPVTVENSCPAVIGPIGVGGPPTGDGAITGYIEDALTFAPLADALVLTSGQTRTAGTEADGRYAFRFLPTPGQFTVSASLLGYLPRSSQVYLSQGETARVDLGLVPVGTPVGSIDGFVTDAATGYAIPGAVVRVAGLVQAITTATGYYLLSGIPAGSVAVQVIAGGYLPVQATAPVTANQTVRLNFALSSYTGSTATLYGQVRDAVSAAPVVGAALSVDAVSGVSGPRGAYLLTFPVPPRTHTLKAASPNYYPFEEDDLPVGASQSVELDIGLVSTATPVGALHGYVLDALHSSVRLGGARVSIGRFLQTLATFPAGEYEVPYVPSGLIYIGTASSDGYVPLTVAGIETTAGQTLEMDWPLISLSDEFQQDASLTVTVLQAGTGLPLAGAVVSVGAFGAADSITDNNGQASLISLLPGNYTASASLTGYRVGTSQVSVMAGTNTCQITLAGFPDSYTGGEVYGYVTAAVLPPGQAVAGCLAECSPAFTGGWTGPNVVTDSGGFYVLDNVPSGIIALTFDEADYDLLTEGGIVAINRTATRADAALSPFDGRLPNGYKLFMGQAVAVDRPVGSIVAVAEGLGLGAAQTQDGTLYAAQEDTAALARFRRVRAGVRTETASSAPVLKLAASLAPGVQVKHPAAVALGIPAATAK